MFSIIFLVFAMHCAQSSEDFRPELHYSPQRNWMNDPNGLVYYDREWHLFYQHYPYEAKAKNIHWGHAVSEDLIHWKELPIALTPEETEVGLWSGSAVVDWKNVTGFQREDNLHPIIAVYTWQKRGWQEQHMAFSLDRGRTWTKYASNPILPLNINVSFPTDTDLNASAVVFRDPKLIYHRESEAWIAAISGGDHIQFHRSTDLIHWTLTSRFGYEEGSHAGVWECPDLIDFGLFDDQIHRWVLIVSIDRNAVAGGSGTQYFVGTFDGFHFRNLQSSSLIQWIDYGPDYYAGISYANVPQYDQRRVMIAWMNNWQYAQDVPTGPLWRGQMAMPRQLDLRWNNERQIYSLQQKPVHELFSSAHKLISFPSQSIDSCSTNLFSNLRSTTFYLSMEFARLTRATNIHLYLRENAERTEYTRVSFIAEKNLLEFDRSHSGQIDFHPLFRTHYNITFDERLMQSKQFQIDLLVDRCSVEIFINRGQWTFTALVFPQLQSDRMSLHIEGNDQIDLNYAEVLLF